MPETLDPILDLTAGIVAAYVGRQAVAPETLPGLMRTVRDGLLALQGPAEKVALPTPPESAIERPTPAQIRKSVQQDGIVSFIDGRSYKTIRRHLTAHGLTPATYCERYGLPADYPMIAPSYAAQRSKIAKAIGLGVPGAHAKRQATE
ncbi:MucR family transcriptional regulator [Methylobacterium mesophilicum SR1.6/6]|uniref:MucR family transcriptional regulator n=1 Tax=Methylobacterium mesophilicum SR1.6/6 TaxID=908290 RepID=A0A6B9FYB4_9HYPH|nr:MucR family transcriptional regulator [Methylobacterium mesophilicum]QGY05518.1 MucR family transcriptional regulator [Methylobacterium mesophilicum SR1.6/6]